MKTDLLKRPTEITPHLRSVELNAAGDKAYSCYDGQGERVRKVVKKSGGVVEERRYMGGYEVYRKTLAGAAVLQRTTHNISDGSTTFCRMERLNTTAPVLRYQYANHLGRGPRSGPPIKGMFFHGACHGYCHGTGLFAHSSPYRH